MKKIIFILLLAFNCTLFSQVQTIQPAPKISQTEFVMGVATYEYGYDFQPNELAYITYLGKRIVVNIDSIKPKDIYGLLKQTGQDSSNIMYLDAWGSSITNRIEIIFAYKGTQPNYNQEINIETPHALYNMGNAYQNGIYIPQLTVLNSENLRLLAIVLASKYHIKTFMCKPFQLQQVPFIVLTNGTIGGNLMDMRWIPNSYRLVDYFKELNWAIIWYNEGGKAKSAHRPKSGWK